MLHAEGTLLTIDAGDRSATTAPIDDQLEQFIGGRAVATKLAHDRIPADADPFGPENRLFWAVGPLQQSRMSFTGRTSLTGLSPLTDGLLSTNAGGYVSRNIVGTGHSVIELTGASDELLAVHVTDDGVTFEPVPELEGAMVSEVTEYMEDAHGLESENLVTIGPAGENLVRFASVMTYDTRAFGRGGLGAVMGAKNVKCISVRGDAAPEIDIPGEAVRETVHREAATSDDMMRRQGTTMGTEMINEIFSLPSRYFSEQTYEHAEAIGGDAVEEKKYEKGSCSVCAFACKLPTRDEDRGIETEGPEFETVFSFGSNCDVDDIVDIMQANELCDEFGLDTISCGDTIAAYLAANDEFGNAELVHDLVENIAYREGDGDLLAEGIDRAHEELGVENWSVKGLEFAAHDGRELHGQGLSYAVANRGADHMYSSIHLDEYQGMVDSDGTADKPEVLIEYENRNVIRDTAIACEFGMQRGVDEAFLETVLDADYDELLAVGARVVDLERHFNNRRGIDHEADRLPYDIPDLAASIREYYTRRGWNEDGTVPDASVEGTVIGD